jgi:50S ribosomal protein L16 3-hydroxylase
MDPDRALALLGGLTPRAFMRRHWHKAPLLVRQALPGIGPPLTRAALFALAGQEGVESRLVVREGPHWRLRQGPMPRRALPPLGRPGWTLLVQGLDLHVGAAHDLLGRFRFVPDARLDDLMVSYATDGGGVGPHLDSYDVFLLQVHGRRRWRIGRVADDTLEPGLPLKILRRFEPEQEWLLEPGDLLYLPPRWGHDGVAEGECMTCSVGFRAPAAGELAREVLLRLAEAQEDHPGARYADPAQPATAEPAAVPPALQRFAARAVATALGRTGALERALGEVLTEPKPQVWFEAAAPALRAGQGVRLDARTRMLVDARHVFVNGESWRAAGGDARLLHTLAHTRRLGAHDVARLGASARAVLGDWLEAGWLHPEDGDARR